MFSVVFGTVLPLMAKHFVLDYNNLQRLFVLEETIFSSISIAFGLMLAVLLLPLRIEMTH